LSFITVNNLLNTAKLMDELDKAMHNLTRLIMGESSEQYTDLALTLAQDPLNTGELESPDGLGFIKGDCGDSMWIYIKMAGDIIDKATFLTDGCGATLACGSAATEIVKNKTIAEALLFSPREIIEYLGDLPASHHHCAVLTANTIIKAVQGIKI